MKSIKRSVFLFIFTILGFSAMSEAIDVNATLTPKEIKIGEQSCIHFEITQPQSASIIFPNFFNDTLVPGIEIIHVSKLDTTKGDNGDIKISQDIIITSFDSGSYTIPAFKFEAKVKIYETEKLFLNVNTIEADFVHSQITDIEDNYEPGINWKRIFLYLSIFVILAGLGFIGYTIYQYFKRIKETTDNDIKEIDSRLPHEIALEELDVIKEEKVWKQGQTKQYYTSITDTLRQYFEKRFNIAAMEMTSSEIIESLKRNNDASPVVDNMEQIFSTSDMVKFAKQEPTLEENELSIFNAYRIINETIYIPPVVEEKDTEFTIEIDDELKNKLK
ncbi:MAG: hypothetical protein MJZ34_10740 [Paludibacteraceae bacterium]|nr:hypothetical protein [Paludibacteraceae bacterium]